MSDMKSKMPDFKELASMTSKLFNDIKTSVGQIIEDYKAKRAESEEDTDVSTEAKPVDQQPVGKPKTKKNEK